MNKANIFVLWILVSSGAVLWADYTSSDAIGPRQIAAMMESTIVDLDQTVIAAHYGFLPSNLTYQSIFSANSWTGRLSGNYGTHQVQIDYSGNIVSIGGPSNQYDIGYTSQWLFDGLAADGSGSSIYTDPDGETKLIFSITITEQGVSSAELAVSYAIQNSNLYGSYDFLSQDLNLGGKTTVDMPLLGDTLDLDLNFGLNLGSGDYGSEILGWTFNKGNIDFDLNNMEVHPIPAPAALLLTGMGVPLVNWLRRRRTL